MIKKAIVICIAVVLVAYAGLEVTRKITCDVCGKDITVQERTWNTWDNDRATFTCPLSFGLKITYYLCKEHGKEVLEFIKKLEKENNEQDN